MLYKTRKAFVKFTARLPAEMAANAVGESFMINGAALSLKWHTPAGSNNSYKNSKNAAPARPAGSAPPPSLRAPPPPPGAGKVAYASMDPSRHALGRGSG